MRGIYDDRHEIPIPADAYINKYDARVFLISPSDSKRTVIGKATSDTLMFPNNTFRRFYPEIWAAEYRDYNDLPGDEMKVGLYGLCLAASKAGGLYDALLSAYDPETANAILDFCMYSISTRRNDAQRYSARMREEIVFSDRIYDESWWSGFFRNGVTESQHDGFRRAWLTHCQEEGVQQVWICIDGSDNDAQMKGSHPGEHGEYRPHDEKSVVGYMWAVDAETGMPVTCHIGPDGRVDATTIQWLMAFLNGYNIEVAGVILNRDFPVHDMTEFLADLKIPYVMLLPVCHGHNAAIEACGDTVIGNPEHLINNTDLYGTSKRERIWKKHPNNGFINLYYRSKKWHHCGSDFNAEVTREKERAEKACLSGTRPAIPKKYRDILRIEQDDEGGFSIRCDYSRWKSRLRSEGFFSILSSEGFGAKETYRIYALRMRSEGRLRMRRSQEGNEAAQVHSDSSMRSMLAVAFATAALRYTIQRGCQATGLDPNRIIQKMDGIRALALDNGKLRLIHDIPNDLKTVFEYFDLDDENFDAVVQEISQRYTDKAHSQIREFPVISKPEPRKRGRQPGSKNRKTIERERAEAEARAQGETIGKAPAKRGRRPGTKDSGPRKKRSDAGKKRGTYRKRDSV